MTKKTKVIEIAYEVTEETSKQAALIPIQNNGVIKGYVFRCVVEGGMANDLVYKKAKQYFKDMFAKATSIVIDANERTVYDEEGEI
jgi:translation initiation factor 1 (eIF-1/SUI1)